MNKEKIVIEYIKNYLKYYEKNNDNEEEKIIFYMIRRRIIELEKIKHTKKLIILNENMRKQAEG